MMVSLVFNLNRNGFVEPTNISTLWISLMYASKIIVKFEYFYFKSNFKFNPCPPSVSLN